MIAQLVCAPDSERSASSRELPSFAEPAGRDTKNRFHSMNHVEKNNEHQGLERQ